MIIPHDRPLLESFLKHESKDYVWKQDGLELVRQSILVQKWVDTIALFDIGEGADYIHFVSMSNMGMTIRELKLTAQKWKSGRNVYVHFGTTPRDGVSIQFDRFDVVEDMTKGGI